MSRNSAPAQSASACPSPVYSHEPEQTDQTLVIPPVARTTDFAENACPFEKAENCDFVLEGCAKSTLAVYVYMI